MIDIENQRRVSTQKKLKISENSLDKDAKKHAIVVVPIKRNAPRLVFKLEKPRGKSPRKTKSKVHTNHNVNLSTNKSHMRLKSAAAVATLATSAIKNSSRTLKSIRVDANNRQIHDNDELTKKIEELSKLNDELKKRSEELAAENETMRQEGNQRELEVEKVVRYWTLSRQQLDAEQERGIALEARIQRMRTAHVEQISLLHKRVSMLQLKAEVRCVSATQTDTFGADSDASQRHSTGCQTIEAWTAQRAHDSLRLNDEQLAELIADIEHQKLQAQTDFKFAVVQVQQDLREKHDAELRQVKEERERQMEDISRIQNDRILICEQEKVQLKKEFTEQIIEQKVQITRMSEKLSDAEAEIRTLSADASQKETAYKRMAAENEVLNKKMRANQIELNEAKRIGQVSRQLRIRLEKIEEINEILLGEYKKVENERNRYVEQLHPSYSNIHYHDRRNAAQEFELQLDAIRREYGGIYLPHKI